MNKGVWLPVFYSWNCGKIERVFQIKTGVLCSKALPAQLKMALKRYVTAIDIKAATATSETMAGPRSTGKIH